MAMFSENFLGDSGKLAPSHFSFLLGNIDTPSPGLKRLAALPLPFSEVKADYRLTSSEFVESRWKRSRDSGIGLDTPDSEPASGLNGPVHYDETLKKLGSLAWNCGQSTNTERHSRKRRRSGSVSRRDCGCRRLDYSDDGLLEEQQNDEGKIAKTVDELSSESDVVLSLSDERDDDVIGDFSKPYCLPTVLGKHSDLKTITPATLATVMAGGFSDVVGDYNIVDCRYPYEYEGGHIHSAKNIWNRDQLGCILADPDSPRKTRKRDILIFHCEFSSERGPKLTRFLRQLDRDLHKESYPTLSYPELYILDGGYKAFYEQFPELCDPKCYKTMLHPNHRNDLKYFRAKSKSYSDVKSKRALCNRVVFKHL